MVTDIAEVVSIFSEAEDNTGINGILIGSSVLGLGTGAACNPQQYQWWARKGYTIS